MIRALTMRVVRGRVGKGHRYVTEATQQKRGGRLRGATGRERKEQDQREETREKK